MRNLNAVATETREIRRGDRMSLYYSIANDAVYTTPAQGRYYVTDLLRPNTPEEIKTAVNRWLAM